MKKSKVDLVRGWLEKARRDLQVALLIPYAVETRYPEFEEPSLNDAKEAVEIAKKVKEFVLGKLPF